MRARAPGKLVISGSYSVLEGAPALVAAADRYAVAEVGVAPPLVTPEVRCAFEELERSDYPGFDASALRSGDRKLGLGSSAAILVASLAVVWPDDVADDALAEALFPLALRSHRRAQGGGSGVDVAAACFGGVIRCAPGDDDAMAVDAQPLVEGLAIETWACPGAASTRAMLEKVGALRESDPSGYRKRLDAAAAGAHAAVAATTVEAFVAALGAQYDALGALGEAAGAPIVTAEMRALDEVARSAGARFGPSGAGGGDIALF
ncbi:MAG: hypothetical protein RIF41_20695, partial [Polyangiaceae bacterium]